MGSGTTIFGIETEAVVAGISGSEDDRGPTWAGATELALAAARTSSADRSATNIISEFCAVNLGYRRATSRSKTHVLVWLWFPVLRGTCLRLVPAGWCPPLLIDPCFPAPGWGVKTKRSFQR